ncbi:malonate--CoA ligase ACSF3, mitochondrial-like [Tigriopus californicus]|uniref:malonate--CoA ligase ACSF3, mitochondrial-like n=1 Tax=Tigriopus californicus TaxID=6832 RepID=UPI0027DA019C|nr:malonate--CoA ligase ACSF3, mitochondrial-like [Tigriopus californicus]
MSCLVARKLPPSKRLWWSTYAQLSSQWHTYSNKVALCESNNAQVTYSELVRDCTAVSQKLKAELKTKHGPSRISFLVPRNRSFVQALFGIFHSGNVAVPLCSDHPSEMLRYYIQNSESDLVIASHQSVDVIHQALKGNGSKRGVVLIEDLLKDGTKEPQPMETCLDDDDALIIYTSGTTGPPKGVVLTHGNLKAQTEAMIQVWDWSPQDSLLHVLPLHHVHGITNCLLTPLSVGASLTMLEKFNPQQVWRFLLQQEERKPNLFMAVPTIYSKLIQTRPRGSNPDEIQTILRSKIRLMVSGSAALPVPVLEKWKSLTGHTLLERYGMTEIGMALTNPLEEWKRIPGSVGRPFPGVSARIVDISSNQSDIVLSESDRRKFKVNHRDKEESSGELQIKGPNVFKEYFGNAEATAKEFTHDGWFKTGDTAFMDRSGVFRILGRTSVDIIKSGGYKISALDIERVLLGHPDIKDVAVIGIPDEEYGQVVTALVVLDDTHKNINLTEISDWMSTKLPKYSVPRIWKSLQTLPRNTMGKVNKKELLKLHLK